VYKLPEPFELRAAGAGDRAFLEDLYFSSREDLHQALPDPTMVRQLVAMQRRMQEAGFAQNFPDAQHLVLQRAGQPIGRLVIDSAAGDLRVVDIAVAPAARRSGAAKAVLKALQAAASERNQSVSLAVAASNQPARALYLGLGFTVRSRDPVVEQMAWRGQAA
jgi:ribosomal protein S18 acetylase RimI-like enzyme